MTLPQSIFEEHWPSWQEHFVPCALLRLGCISLSALAGDTSLQRDGMARDALSEAEYGQWTGFSQEKRRIEWFGGRLAAKWAAAKFMAEKNPSFRTVVIRSERDGRPSLVTEGPAHHPFISISHSGPLAVAMAANIPCGLDIQQPEAKILRVKERFVNPEEADIMNASLPGSFTEEQRFTMLWAIKEAVRKMVRISPLLGLLEIRLLAAEQSSSATPQAPLVLTIASGRNKADCPATIPVLCFFSDNLAWAMACPSATTKE